MAKSDSSEQVRAIPFNGDLYLCYHINGIVTQVLVRYDNMSKEATPVEWSDLPEELQQLMDDQINFGDTK